MKKRLFFLPAVLAALFCENLHGQDIPVSIQSGNTLPAAFQNYTIRFSGNSKVLRKDYSDNDRALSELIRRIDEHRTELENGEYLIRVASNVAPVGISASKAHTLARKRALVVKSYLIRKAGAREAYFSTQATTQGKIKDNTLLTLSLVPASPRKDATGSSAAPLRP